MCTQNGITINLFGAVNPSTTGDSVASYSELLHTGVTYYIGPIDIWDSVDELAV